MNKKLLFLFFSVWTLTSLSQGRFRILSEELAQPIVDVKVQLFEDGKLKQTTSSDEGGFFKFQMESLKTLKAEVTFTHPDYLPRVDSLKTEGNQIFYLRKKTASQELNEVVVTGQTISVRANQAVQKITVINRTTIEQKGAINLRDVLQNELNIRVSQDAILGSGLSIKGVGDEGIKILIDGVPVIGRNDGAIDLSQLNLANIERIELVDGPLSVQYGSNAIGGTINLITKKGSRSNKEVGIQSYYESNGHYNLGGNFNISKGKWTALGHFGRQYFAGWRDDQGFFNQPFNLLADSTRFKTWKPKEQFTFGGRLMFRGNNWQITPFYEGLDETILNRGFPRPPYQILAFDETYKTKRFNQGVDFSMRPKDKFLLKGQAAFQNYERVKNSYITDLTTLERNQSASISDHDTNVFHLIFSRFTFSPLKSKSWFKYEVGTEINHETGKGQRIQNQQQNIGDYALFAVTDFTLWKKLVLQPAGRLNYNTAYGFIAIPSFHAKLSQKQHTFRASYARGFRTPSLKELYLEFVDINHNIFGNPNLLPESSHYTQFWWTYNDTIGKWLITTELNPFAQRITNKISLAQSGQNSLFTYFNLNDFQSFGVQATLAVKKSQWQARVGASYLGIKTNFHLRTHFTPELTANFQYQVPGSGWSIHTFYKYTGKIDAFVLSAEDEITNVRMDDYHLLDFQLQFQTKNKRWKWQLGGKNLLNVGQINALNANSGVHSSGTTALIGTGRTIYVGLQWKLISDK